MTREPVIMNEWVDPRTGALVQQIANDRPQAWDRRPFFYIAYPNGAVGPVGATAGDTAIEAVRKMVERRPTVRLAA